MCAFQLSSALLFDAVHTVVAAVQELNRSQNVGATQLSCKSSKIWEHGTSLMNYLRMVRRTAGRAHDLPIISPAGTQPHPSFVFSLYRCGPRALVRTATFSRIPEMETLCLTRPLKINDHQFVITASFNACYTVYYILWPTSSAAFCIVEIHPVKGSPVL